MVDLINIGLSGLNASKTRLSTSGHNISNIDTPGFSRQSVSQTSSPALPSGVGYLGTGTSLVDVRRTYSEFLTGQVRSTTSLSSSASTYQGQVEQLDALLSGSTTSLAPSLQSFFGAMQTAADDPANLPARQQVLSEAGGLAQRFNALGAGLAEQNAVVNRQMGALGEQINRLAGSVGNLNEKISAALANGQQPNDLLDLRDETVRQLSSYVGVNVVAQDDKSYNVFIGSGQPLVVGNQVSRLDVGPSASDPTRNELQLQIGDLRQNITGQISGGELGGLLRFRDDVLVPSQNALGRLALTVADQVNGQLGQGLDLQGRTGAALFEDINSPAQVAQRSYPTGMSVRIENTGTLQAKDYSVRIESATDGTYRMREANGAWSDTLYTFGEDNGQGFSLTPEEGATFADGATLTIMPTRRAAGDLRVQLDQTDRLAFAAPVRAGSGNQNGGTGTIGQPELVESPSPLVATDLKAALGADGLTLRYNGTSGALEDADGNSYPVTAGSSNTLSLSTGGYRLEFSFGGRPADGDTFTLSFNANGVSDNRNALKLADLQNRTTLDVAPGSGATFSEDYGGLIERVGTRAAQSKLDSEATGALLQQATDSRDSLSAVSLDEEAANLIKFEQYYNASAQIVQVARNLFDTLLSSIR